jgi:glycosyltransferase involved in cell wall biosynthesis
MTGASRTRTKSSLRIALLGTRGVPARYSGFETCAEELGARLVERGHDVTVYCRTHYSPTRDRVYRGMRRVTLPTLRQKYLDTIVHTAVSTAHSLTQRFDVMLYFIAGNSPLCWIPRIVGTRTVLNVDGLDWKREKWPPVAKQYLQITERLATRLPNACVTDSYVVQASYRERFRHDAMYIPYGSELERRAPGETLARLGLTAGRYVLFVGRLVAENCVDHLIDAFPRVRTDFKCVIVGGSSYADDYIRWLHEKAGADPRIMLTGYLFGEAYRELGSNAGLFVETSGVGGTHPALVEAMAFDRCVVTHNTPENLETIADAGRSYAGAIGAPALAEVLQELLDRPEVLSELGRAAGRRARQYYTWQAVTDAYERLFHRLCEP